MPPYAKKFAPGEVLLIYFHENPTIFARIEEIRPDRKKGWWQLTFLPLALPLQLITWTLDDDQVRGATFTMQQEPIRLERVEAPLPAKDNQTPQTQGDSAKNPGGRIVSLFDE